MNDLAAEPTTGGGVKTVAGFDQTTLDTVSFGQRNSGGTHYYDEIRFGATYEDVIGQGGSADAPYDSWAAGPWAGTLTDASAELDFDGGGLATGLEWVLGGDPTDGGDDAGLLPTIDATSDPDGKLLFVFRRSTDAAADANTTIVVEYGSDLSGWTTAIHGGSDPEDITISEVVGGFGAGIDQVTVALPSSLAATGKLFARLHVVVTE